jgi:hypothetical protein
VDAEAAPPLGHADQGVDELGQLGLEGGELVDDDEQAGHGLGQALAQVVGQVGGPDVAQRALTVLELGLEAPQGALGQVLVEVGHHADRVGQLGALVERAAALEVDQHEREVVGVDGGRQPGDHRPQ